MLRTIVAPPPAPSPARISGRGSPGILGGDDGGLLGGYPPVNSGPPVPTTVTPQPSHTQRLAPAAAQQLTIGGLGAVIPPVYGEAQVGGILVMCEEVGNYLYCAYLLCWGEIDSVPSILFGDATPAQLGLVLNTDYFVYLGTGAQTLNTMLNGADPRWIYAYNGTETNSEGGIVPQVAYVAVRFKRRAPGTPSVDPQRMTAVVKGLKVRDHRLDPTLTTRYYSDNPALASADWKTDGRFGEGEPDTIFGDWSTVDGSADACDTFCSDGITKRYVIGLSIRNQDTGENNFKALLAHFMGYSVFNEGQLKMYADVAVSSFAGVKHFSDGSDAAAINIRGDEFVTIHTKGIEEIPTCVEVQYTASHDGWQTRSVFIPNDSAPKDNLKTYSMPGIPTRDQAHRTGIQLYNRGRNDKLFTLPVSAEWLESLPGNPVTISTYGGLSSTEAVLTDAKARGEAYSGGYAIGFLYDPAAYSDVVQTEDSAITSSLPDPNALPPAPTGMTVAEYLATDSSGRAVSVILVTLTTGNTALYHRTRITLDRGDGNGELTVGYIGGGPDTAQVERIEVPVIGAVNTVRAYTQAYPSDLESTPASQTITPVFNTTPPPSVTGLNAPNATADEMGTVWWTTPSSPLVQTVVVYVQVSSSWVRVWSHDRADAIALVSASSPLNLKPYIHVASDGSMTFAVRVITIDKIGNASSPVDASWYLPSTLTPTTLTISAEKETILMSSDTEHFAATAWSGARAGTGTGGITENDGDMGAQASHGDNGDGTFTDTVHRGFVEFDTSRIPDAAVISAAYLLFKNAFAQSYGGTMEVFESTALNDPAHTSDWTAFNATLLGSETVANLNAEPVASRRINLNSSGIALINVTGKTRFCVRDSFDVSNTRPGVGQTEFFEALSSTANNCQLVVVYTLPDTGSGSGGGSTVVELGIAAYSTGPATFNGSATDFTLVPVGGGSASLAHRMLFIDRTWLWSPDDYSITVVSGVVKISFTKAWPAGTKFRGFGWT